MGALSRLFRVAFAEIAGWSYWYQVASGSREDSGLWVEPLAGLRVLFFFGFSTQSFRLSTDDAPGLIPVFRLPLYNPVGSGCGIDSIGRYRESSS